MSGGIRHRVGRRRVLQRLTSLGYQVSFLPGDEFKAFVVKDADQWKSVAKTAKISLE